MANCKKLIWKILVEEESASADTPEVKFWAHIDC